MMPGRNVRDELMAGGTSVAAESNPWSWLPLLIGGAVALGAIIWFVVSDESEPAKPAAMGARPPGAAAPGSAGAPQGPQEPEPPAAPTDPVGERKAAVISALEQAFAQLKLFAAVEWEDDHITVQSSFCNEGAAQVDAAAAALREAGFRSLRCVAPSGVVAYDKQLGP